MGNHIEFIFRGIFMGFYGNFTGISKFFFWTDHIGNIIDVI